VETDRDLQFRVRLDEQKTERRRLFLGINEAEKEFQDQSAILDDTKKAQVLVQAVVAELQNVVHLKVAALVTDCLRAVFDREYTFRIEFDSKRGKTEARMVLGRDGLDVDPMTESGGGVVDVIAFALRLAAVLFRRPAVRPVLFLDEPFRFVSVDYLPRVADLLTRLANDLGVQILMVTHIEELRCGKEVDVSQLVLKGR
jgi:DNA repair exonuclease SbcCD ATPase subunit